jgi:hypothetical protein
MKVYVNKSIGCLFVLCFILIPCGYASHDKSPATEMRQKYCNFNGILKDKIRWAEEFKMLEDPSDYPTFEVMSDMLSVFMTMPKSLIKECPSLENYLSELVKYHANNKKIKKEVSRAIEYISKKLQSDSEGK